MTHHLKKYSDYGLLPLRIALGAVFIYHGYLKLFTGNFPGGTAGFFASLGIPLPTFFAIIVSLLEFFGGIALLLGLMTRYTSVLLAVNMLVALLLVHLPNGFLVPGGIEFVLTLFAGLLTLDLIGAGKYSADDYIL